MEPFDPEKHEPLPRGDGKKMTELTATGQDSEGFWFNYPQIWFKGEKPRLLSGEKAFQQALSYESESGNLFPRFDSKDEAVAAAKARSDSGGASKSLLIDQKIMEE